MDLQFLTNSTHFIVSYKLMFLFVFSRKVFLFKSCTKKVLLLGVKLMLFKTSIFWLFRFISKIVACMKKKVSVDFLV